MTPSERAQKIVAKLCTWIRPSDAKYVIVQIRAAIAEEREACARAASHYTIVPEAKNVHPNIAFKDMSETAKTVAHMTAQGIAGDIRARGGE